MKMISTALAETVSKTTETGNTILGIAIVIVVAAFIIWRKRKKKGGKPKPAEKRNSGSNSTQISGSNSGMISIKEFQKVVYNRFVVFDLETTGLSRENDKIIEIGAVRVENGKITERYQRLVDPKIPIPAAASKVNHITNEMVSGYPPIELVLPHFLKFVGNDVLAAHNAGFDSSFLRAACRECRQDPPKAFFDTMRLSVYWPNLKNQKLETFLSAAGIKNNNAHRALDDAEATAELIIKSFDKIK